MTTETGPARAHRTDDSLGFLGDKVAATIQRLEQEAAGDGRTIAQVSATLAEWEPRSETTWLESMTTLAERSLLPVAREVGRLLFQLALSKGPVQIVEYGTSFGMSTLFLAAAARETGGRVIGTEMSEHKAAHAAKNLESAGLSDYADILVGDARTELKKIDGPVGLLLLDGWVPLYLPIFQQLEPHLVPGSLVVADTVAKHADRLDGFYEHVDAQGDRYARTRIPLDDGIDVISRVR
ncbi:class I SAM-dependent methyltransferase [Spirillospora sp. NBC_00431]